MLMNAVGCEVIHLPKGVRERNTAVLNGEAEAMIAPLTGAVKLTKAGKLRILLMPTDERSAIFPDVPTAKELGHDVTLDLFRGLSVPAGTPEDVKAKLADAMAQATAANVTGSAWPTTLADLGLAPADLAADRPGLRGRLAPGH